MKNLLIVLVLVLGASSINAQGFINHSLTSIKQKMNSSNGYTLSEGTQNGRHYAIVQGMGMYVFFYFDRYQVVDASVIWYDDVPMYNRVKATFASDYKNIGHDTWISYLDAGSVTIKAHPATPTEGPSFEFNWKVY